MQKINLTTFLETIKNNSKYKCVKLNVEAELQPNNWCEIKIKSIEVDRELLKELGIEPKTFKEKGE